MSHQSIPEQKYMRVRDILKSDVLTEKEKHQLRYWIANASPKINAKGYLVHGNGLDRAIIRIGRVMLIDKGMFLLWLKEYREVLDIRREFNDRPEAITRLLKKRRRR